jgi:hypothetical protein
MQQTLHSNVRNSGKASNDGTDRTKRIGRPQLGQQCLLKGTTRPRFMRYLSPHGGRQALIWIRSPGIGAAGGGDAI